MPLLPNSPEWIAALEKIDPPQAGVSRMFVQKLGHENFCVVCGDEPARDYQKDGSPLLMRLCADCISIRKMQGEKLQPLNA